MNSNVKYLLYIFLSGFFHFSLIAVIGIFVFFYLTPLKRYSTVYFALFVVTFLIAESNIEGISNLMRNYTPGAFQIKVDNYAHDENIQNFKADFVESRSWHAIYYIKALLYSIFYLISITYFFNIRERLLIGIQNIFLSFSLILFSFANIISQFPSGGRFYTIAFLFSFIPITSFYSMTKHKNLFHFAFFPLLFFLIVNIRDGFEHITMATFFLILCLCGLIF